MKTFEKYVEFHDDNALNGPSDSMGNSAGEKPLDALFNITKLAWERYRSQMESFFADLAEEDEEIKSQFEKLGDHLSILPRSTKKAAGMSDADEDNDVVRAAADGSPGLEDGGGGQE